VQCPVSEIVSLLNATNPYNQLTQHTQDTWRLTKHDFSNNVLFVGEPCNYSDALSGSWRQSTERISRGRERPPSHKRCRHGNVSKTAETFH